jgi:hypothetical protein
MVFLFGEFVFDAANERSAWQMSNRCGDSAKEFSKVDVTSEFSHL